MEELAANFIPLGRPKGQRSHAQDKPKPEKIIGSTPEERKRIAAEVRKAAKREKKQIKADAKRQRKLNGILHRRMTKNPEKYSHNKERNRIRAIEAERTKIQHEAVRQAQRLAAKYDPSGKMFNVGEIVILEDGSVKSKAALAFLERRKAERQAEREAMEKLAPEDMLKKGTRSKAQQQKKAALEPRPPLSKPVVPEGISLPEGEADFISMWDITDEQIQKRLNEEKRKKSIARSNLRKEQKAQKKINKAMKLLKRQMENRGEKWDKVEGRRIVLKALEGDASEEDSQQSSEDNDSENEDQDIEEIEAAVEANETQKLEEPVDSAKAVKESKKSKKAKKISNPASSGDAAVERVAPVKEFEAEIKKAKSSKRAAEDDAVEEPKAKKSKKSKNARTSDNNSEEAVEASGASGASDKATTTAAPDSDKEVRGKQALKEERRALKAQERAVREEEICAEKENQRLLASADEQKENARKEEKRAKKESKKEAAKASQANSKNEKKPKKRKHEDDEADAPVEKGKSKKGKHNEAIEALAETQKQQKRNRVEDEAPSEALPPSLDKQDKYYTTYTKADEEPVKHFVEAAQWNPEALSGEAARKEKFLRLLGAGKTKVAPDDGTRHKSSAKEMDIRKVQSDLERQYEAGRKMKHDGGGKRRGLGA